MHVLIAAERELCYFLGRRLLGRSHGVTLVHGDREVCAALARQLDTLVVHGDATDPELLEQAGAGSCDAVIVALSCDERNLAVAQQSRVRFQVPRVFAVLNDPDNEEVFRKLGIQDSLSLVRMMAMLVEERASFEDIVNLLPLAGGKVNLSEVRLSEDSPALRKRLKDVGLPPGCLVACILRDDEPLVPAGDTSLEENDRLVVITRPEMHHHAMRMLVDGSRTKVED